MNFKHDLAEIARGELRQAGIKVPKEWDDYQACMKYLEIHHRWFDSSVPYAVVYSKELREKYPTLTPEEQEAIRDIEKRLNCCETLTPYMSRDIRATSVKKSDFLLKNWNIYHLHLEKSSDGYQNPNLLFFQPKGRVVHLIDVKPHPKGTGWFDRALLEIVYDNWPHLLNYRPGMKPTCSIPDDGVHDLLKSMVAFIPFRDGGLFPTNLGVVASGDSGLAVRETDRMFNTLTTWERELMEREDEVKQELLRLNLEVPDALDYSLEVEDGFFIAYEIHTQAKIRMFEVPQ